MRTIFQPRTLSADIPASQKGVYWFYNRPIHFHTLWKPLVKKTISWFDSEWARLAKVSPFDWFRITLFSLWLDQNYPSEIGQISTQTGVIGWYPSSDLHHVTKSSQWNHTKINGWVIVPDSFWWALKSCFHGWMWLGGTEQPWNIWLPRKRIKFNRIKDFQLFQMSLKKRLVDRIKH